MTDSRDEIMLSIALADYPDALYLDEAQRTDYLRNYIRDNSTEGTLKSRRHATKLMQLVVAHLVDLGCTDQDLFELLYSVAGGATDQYRSWSPEFEFPLTNNEVRDMLTYASWDDLVEALNGGLPESPAAKRLIPHFYVAWGDGEQDCWLERSGQGDSSYPRFTESDFNALD